MHRSGTSALTRALNLVGAAMPDNLLSPNPDNESGYWESVDVIRLNTAVLEAAGTAWNDDMRIPDEWFGSEAAHPFLEKGAAFLRANIHPAKPLVLKDPRLCRLLPFWNRLMADLGLSPHYVLILRFPVEVYFSLQSRGLKVNFQTMAVNQREKSDLLWLRYVLEAEHQTRASPRSIVTYDALLANPLNCMTRILREAGMDPAGAPVDAGVTLSELISPALRRQVSRKGEPGAIGLAAETYGLFDQHVCHGRSLDTDSLDRIYAVLNAVSHEYAPIRATSRLRPLEHSQWPSEILEQVFLHTRRHAREPARVIFISGLPGTPNHRYRVEHPIEALTRAGIAATWVPVVRAEEADVRAGDIVIIFRAPWSPEIERLHARCVALRVPIGVDIDELLFDPIVMSKNHLGLHRFFSAGARRSWLAECENYQRLMKAADFGLFPTQLLAAVAARHMARPFELPNGIGQEMIECAARAGLRKDKIPPYEYGKLRFGFVSGTTLSSINFRVVATVLDRLLTERGNAVLTIVGSFNVGEFPALRRYGSRVEIRPSVEHAALLDEYARFDVNLAPCERGNAFCEAKSQRRFLEAALVGVPTIATPTMSYLRAIGHGETGLFAGTTQDWYAALTRLLDDATERQQLGGNARAHALAAYGPEMMSMRLRNVLGSAAGIQSRVAS